jgi:hypothetical protein
MSIFDSYGAPQFGLKDVKIAAWSSTGSYGTAVDVPSVQMLSTNIETINAELEGDDQITDTHAKRRSGEVTFRFGAIDLDVWEVLTGEASVESGPSPNEKSTLTMDADSYPYIGIVGIADATQGDGDLHIFIPKCKIMGNVALKLEYGQYSIPEVTLKAIPDGDYGICQLIEHETAVVAALPPA